MGFRFRKHHFRQTFGWALIAAYVGIGSVLYQHDYTYDKTNIAKEITWLLSAALYSIVTALVSLGVGIHMVAWTARKIEKIYRRLPD
jgi:hypothetical protein